MLNVFKTNLRWKQIQSLTHWSDTFVNPKKMFSPQNPCNLAIKVLWSNRSNAFHSWHFSNAIQSTWLTLRLYLISGSDFSLNLNLKNLYSTEICMSTTTKFMLYSIVWRFVEISAYRLHERHQEKWWNHIHAEHHCIYDPRNQTLFCIECTHIIFYTEQLYMK